MADSVSGGADDHPGSGLHRRLCARQHLGGGVRGDPLGQAEIQNLHEPVDGHLDVLRLQIAVDDPGLMCRGKPFRQLTGDPQGAANIFATGPEVAGASAVFSTAAVAL